MIPRAAFASWLLAGLILAVACPAARAQRAQPAGFLPYLQLRVIERKDAGFTQGLFLHKGLLYVSDGRYGASRISKVDPATGSTLARRVLPARVFAEGSTVVGDTLYVLTWREQLVLLFDIETFKPKGELPLAHEGWGITTVPEGVWVSDGSHVLRLYDPATFTLIRSVEVFDGARPVTMLNELEAVNGFILANVWHEDQVVVIDTANGKVVGRIDFAPLRAKVAGMPDGETDLNGLAFDAGQDLLYVTGKSWPAVFVVKVGSWPRAQAGKPANAGRP